MYHMYCYNRTAGGEEEFVSLSHLHSWKWSVPLSHAFSRNAAEVSVCGTYVLQAIFFQKKGGL